MVQRRGEEDSVFIVFLSSLSFLDGNKKGEEEEEACFVVNFKKILFIMRCSPWNCNAALSNYPYQFVFQDQGKHFNDFKVIWSHAVIIIPDYLCLDATLMYLTYSCCSHTVSQVSLCSEPVAVVKDVRHRTVWQERCILFSITTKLPDLSSFLLQATNRILQPRGR